MPRYSLFKYGNAAQGGGLYGAAPSTTALMYSFLVAWDGTYSGDNEATRMVDFQLTRGRDTLVTESGFEHYKPGQVTAVFDNDDGRYDAWDTSGPLYPNVTPGKFVRCLVMNGSAGTNYALMRGIITDIQPFNKGQRRFVRIVVKDGLEWLAGQVVNVEKNEDFTFGANVKEILDACAIDTAEWPYSTNNVGNTIPFTWFSEKTALRAINELEGSELGTFRQRRDGTFFWSSRTTGVITTTTVTQEEVLRDIVIQQPWEAVINNARMTLNPLTSHNITATIWELEDVPRTLTAGEEFTMEVSFRHPTLNIPVAADNVEVFAQGGGSLYDFDDNPAGGGAFLAATVTLENAGETGTLFFRNDSGGTGYLLLLSVVGDAIYAQYQSVLSADDTASQALYGKKTMTIKTEWMQRADICQDRVDDIVAALASPIPMPVISIENRATLQFNYDLFEHGIRLQLAAWGLDETYRIGKIEHRWLNENGQAIRTVYKLEPVLTFT